MKLGRNVEFFLVGIAVVPAVLLFAGYPELALFNLIPLVFAAFLSGIADRTRHGKDDKLNVDE